MYRKAYIKVAGKKYAKAQKNIVKPDVYKTGKRQHEVGDLFKIFLFDICKLCIEEGISCRLSVCPQILQLFPLLYICCNTL